MQVFFNSSIIEVCAARSQRIGSALIIVQASVTAYGLAILAAFQR